MMFVVLICLRFCLEIIIVKYLYFERYGGSREQKYRRQMLTCNDLFESNALKNFRVLIGRRYFIILTAKKYF
jgi:hypothetical protein